MRWLRMAAAPRHQHMAGCRRTSASRAFLIMRPANWRSSHGAASLRRADDKLVMYTACSIERNRKKRPRDRNRGRESRSCAVCSRNAPRKGSGAAWCDNPQSWTPPATQMLPLLRYAWRHLQSWEQKKQRKSYTAVIHYGKAWECPSKKRVSRFRSATP